jgi:hypothetical protein
MRRLLLSALEFSHNLLKETVREGDVVIDVTVGNGNDTVLLAGLSQQVTLFHQGHEPIPEVLGNEEQIGGIIFNLGYLPGSDKSIITRKETPLQAVAA